MIFVGDIALPFTGAISFQNLPNEFLEKNWFGNLEGSIVCDESPKLTNAVFNHKAAILSLTKMFNFSGFALANNHILDTGNFHSTISALSALNIPFCGIGQSTDDASKPLLLVENGIQIVILNFGWEVIQCKLSSSKKIGVNPLKREHILKTVESAILEFPDAKIIPFFHWSYELEAEPQPFERSLAMRLIELGVAGVIGCHPHRVGGFEMYLDRPIIYSLGNWLFKQNYYRNGQLKFPDFCDLELAFEWDFINDKFKFHFFKFERSKSILTYCKTEGLDSEIMKDNTPFHNMSNKDYKIWYKLNHYHKGKGLPTYYWEDNRFNIFIKNKINKIRDSLIFLYFKIKK